MTARPRSRPRSGGDRKVFETEVRSLSGERSHAQASVGRAMGPARQGARARTSRRQRQPSARGHRLALQGLQRLPRERRQASRSSAACACRRTSARCGARAATTGCAAPGCELEATLSPWRRSELLAAEVRRFQTGKWARWSQLDACPGRQSRPRRGAVRGLPVVTSGSRHGDATAQHRRPLPRQLTLTSAREPNRRGQESWAGSGTPRGNCLAAASRRTMDPLRPAAPMNDDSAGERTRSS